MNTQDAIDDARNAIQFHEMLIRTMKASQHHAYSKQDYDQEHDNIRYWNNELEALNAQLAYEQRKEAKWQAHK